METLLGAAEEVVSYLWQNKAWIFTWFLIAGVFNAVDDLRFKIMLVKGKLERLDEGIGNVRDHIEDRINRIQR